MILLAPGVGPKIAKNLNIYQIIVSKCASSLDVSPTTRLPCCLNLIEIHKSCTNLAGIQTGEFLAGPANLVYTLGPFINDVTLVGGMGVKHFVTQAY